MSGVLRVAWPPVLRAWTASKSGEIARLPRPRDVPETHTAGLDRIRILMFGGGIAVGWGVLSHDIAVPGALGRAITFRTGRGCDVVVAATPHLKVSSALRELGKVDLGGYDAIVISLGVDDATALTPLRSWARDLTRTLRTTSQRARPDVRIFVAGVHPIRSIPTYDHFLGSVADAHAEKINAITAHMCGAMPRATHVRLTAPESSGPLRFRDAMSYRHWASQLAEPIAQQLEDMRRGVTEPVGGDAGSGHHRPPWPPRPILR